MSDRKVNCWICGEYGHRPAPMCLISYEVKRMFKAKEASERGDHLKTEGER